MLHQVHFGAATARANADAVVRPRDLEVRHERSAPSDHERERTGPALEPHARACAAVEPHGVEGDEVGQLWRMSNTLMTAISASSISKPTAWTWASTRALGRRRVTAS